MMKQLPSALLEAVEVLLIAIGSSILSTFGFLLEGRALDAFSGGDVALAGWFLFMGLIALYFGVYLLGVGELLPRLKAVTVGV